MTGLVLHVNDALTVNRSLVVGNAGDVVTVTADQVQLNLENGMSEGLINGTQIRQLSLNNRNYEQLLLLQPGVSYGGASDQLYIGTSLPSGTSDQVAFSIDGSRPSSNNWTLDGADNVDRGANFTLLSYPSVDAIAEFKTLRGTYLAEYGRNASGQIDVVIKSGQNAIHGSAYEFFRNDIFNANAYFNKVSTLVALGPCCDTTTSGTRLADRSIFRIFTTEGTKRSSSCRRRFVELSTMPQQQLCFRRRLRCSGDFTQGFGGNTPGSVAVCTSYAQNQAAGTTHATAMALS